jgi:hypothetical protein
MATTTEGGDTMFPNYLMMKGYANANKRHNPASMARVVVLWAARRDAADDYTVGYAIRVAQG